MRCCAKCSTPGYGCANGICLCHSGARAAMVVPNVPAPLPRRQRQVLSMLLSGYQNSQIADELQISRHTVREHLDRFREKHGLQGRAETFALARSLGVEPYIRHPKETP